MTIKISRRSFALGSAGLLASSLLPAGALAQGATRSVTTSLGTYDIPAAPQRVIGIDSRIDLQPAIALGLPVVGYAHSVPGPWVPVKPDCTFVGSPVNLEQVLQLNPDLIICADYDPDSEWWPLNKLRELAPVLPTNGDTPWKDTLRQLAGWLGKDGVADGAMAEYDALIADIKARHGEKLTTRTVVSVQPREGGALGTMNGSTMLQTQVLADLGARTIPPAEGQLYDGESVSSENFADLFGEVDGFLLATTAPEQVDLVANEPLWQRLPAVAAGALVSANGNINYGSIYSAIQVAKLLDELYGKIA